MQGLGGARLDILMLPFSLLVGGLNPNILVAQFTPTGNASSPLTATFSTPALGASPSFLALSPGRALAYAANHGGPAIGVTSASLAWDSNGTLATATTLAHSPTLDPCHILLHPSGTWLFTASYSDGTLSVLPVSPSTGAAGPPLRTLALGLNAHETVLDPSGRFLFVPLLGSDAIAQLTFDPTSGALEENAAGGAAALPRGSGPRHLAFHPPLPVAYVLCELTSQVARLSFDAAAGVLEAVPGGAVSTLQGGGGGGAPPQVQAAADVLVSSDGRFLYATNRASPWGAGENSVAVFAVDGATGALSPLQWATGGAGAQGGVNFPRHAALVPLPKEPYLVTANQLGATLSVFSRDAGTGLLAAVATVPSAPVQLPSFVFPVV